MVEEKIVAYADPYLVDEIPWHQGQIREYVEAIKTAMRSSDFETIKDAGHRMKGSGAP